MEFGYNEELFTSNDFKVYAIICNMSRIRIADIVEYLDFDLPEITKSLKKLERLGWIVEKNDFYYLNVAQIFNKTLKTLIKRHNELRTQDHEFIQQTASSMEESITAANGHITTLNENLLNEVKSLTSKLNSKIDDTLTKYESNRLRQFGIFRINLDNFMRTIKEDLIRELRIQLGFTPNGEFNYTENPVIPDMPSALSIAENANNARELIRRGFLQLINQMRENIEEYNQEYRLSMRDHIQELEEQFNTTKTEINNVLQNEQILLDSLLNKTCYEFGSAKTTSIYQFQETQKTLQQYFETQIESFMIEIEKIVYETSALIAKEIHGTINELGKYTSEFLPKLIDLEDMKNKGRIDKLNVLYSSTLAKFVEKAENALDTLYSIVKRAENEHDYIDKTVKNIAQQAKNLKEIIYETIKKQPSDSNLEKELQKIVLLLEKLGVELDYFKDTLTTNKSIMKKEVNTLKKLLNPLNKDITHFTKLEVDIHNLLSLSYKKQSQSFYKRLAGLLEVEIRKLMENLITKQQSLDDKIKQLIEKFNCQLSEQLEEQKNDFQEQYEKEIQQIEDNLNIIATSFEERKKEVNTQFNNVQLKISNLLNEIGSKIKAKLDKILNSHELTQARIHSESKDLYETLETSLIARINALENNLGREYEELLRYYEQSRETTIGTVKTLLDDMTRLLNKKIELIWTSILRELNSLQEKTSSIRANQITKNKIIETSSKIISEIENQIKGIEIAMQMLADSFKLSFDELYKKSQTSTSTYHNDLTQLKEFVEHIIKESVSD